MATGPGLERRSLLRWIGGGIVGSVAIPIFTRVGTAVAATAGIDTLTLITGGLDTRQPDQPQNSDVFMIARVDVPTRTVRAVSIPRDLYLEIPSFGYDKITRAYDFGSKADNGSFKGGAAAMVATVATNFGVEVDGVVLTTFEGFVNIVDAFGGVDVDNPYDVYDAQYPTNDFGTKEIYFPAGANHLNGEQALEFARTRHQDGDDGRVMRQHLVLRALLERARDAKITTNLPSMVKKHRKSVRTNLTGAEQLALTAAVPSFSNDGVTFGTLSGMIYPDTGPGGMWIYSGDWSQIPGYVQGFLNGQA
jgi:LCP family protein required for cell wall assembly